MTFQPVFALAFLGFLALPQPGFAQAPCEVPEQYPSIQSAVDDQACRVVNIAPGTYFESIFIRRIGLTVVGAGIDRTIIDAGRAGSPIETAERSRVTIIGMTLTNGLAERDGGGLHVGRDGAANVQRVRMTGNEAERGGGVFSAFAKLVMSDCRIDSNIGGGIVAFAPAQAFVERTLVENNSGGDPAIVSGDDFEMRDSVVRNNTGDTNTQGTVMVRFGRFDNVLIAGNVMEVGGGGISVGERALFKNGAIVNNVGWAGVMYNGGDVEFRNVTISGNVGVRGTGGLDFENGGNPSVAMFNVTMAHNRGTTADNLRLRFGSARLTNTIISSADGSSDCIVFGNGRIFSDGGNVASDDTCQLDGLGDRPAVGDVLLAPLSDNGGATPTHALLPGSPAIDAVVAAQRCGGADQRGVPRPQGVACDSGAFEVEGD